MVSSASLYNHNNLIRPSFPAIIEFSNIFEIKEAYEDFSLYVSKNGDSKEKDAFKVYFNMKVQQYCGNDHIIELNACKNLSLLTNESVMIDAYTIEETVKKILKKISYSYLNSDQFKKMKREYFIRYN